LTYLHSSNLNFRERLKSKRLDTRHQASKLTFKRPRLSAVNF
jgi:hypothetical protein